MASDDFDWIRNSGGTPSQLTGPDTDRLGNTSGYYIFIETSNPRVTGDKARLISQQFNGASSSSCFTFWYHMYGQSIRSLNLYQLVGKTETLIWTQSGNKGNSWLSGRVPVGNVTGYKIIAEGVRGNSYTGDIAIDDFKIISGVSCQITPASANPYASKGISRPSGPFCADRSSFYCFYETPYRLYIVWQLSDCRNYLIFKKR